MFNILLGEDDKNFGVVLKSELEEDQYEESQYHVDLVPNRVEVVLNFIVTSYDFVLLDIRMPRLNGNDTLRIIKKINPRVPAITFSGNAGGGERDGRVGDVRGDQVPQKTFRDSATQRHYKKSCIKVKDLGWQSKNAVHFSKKYGNHTIPFKNLFL